MWLSHLEVSLVFEQEIFTGAEVLDICSRSEASLGNIVEFQKHSPVDILRLANRGVGWNRPIYYGFTSFVPRLWNILFCS